MDRERVLQVISAALPVLRERFAVKEVGVFGSVARGDAGQSSDVDILVDFFSPPGFFDFIRLENFLSALLGRQVDLLSKKAIKPVIREAVLRETVYV